MYRHLRGLLVLFAVAAMACTLCAPAWAQDPEDAKKAEKQPGGEEDVQAQAGEKPALRYVNIAAEFGEGYEYLADIGARIDDARQKLDAKALTSLAVTLFEAERASEKQSSAVTGVMLLTEATDIAKLAQDANALGHLAAIWGDHTLGAGDRAKQEEVRALAEEAAGKTKRGPNTGDIVFDNWTNWWIKCYVDGWYRGYVAPWGELTVYNVGVGPTSLYARADFTDGSWKYWGTQWIQLNPYMYYTWRLWP